MKKLRFVLGSAAFLVAVGMAFATKTEPVNFVRTFYEEPSGGTCSEIDEEDVPAECDLNQQFICTINDVTYYYSDVDEPCDIELTKATP